MNKQKISVPDLIALSAAGKIDTELRQYLEGYLVNMFNLDREVPVDEWWSAPLPAHFNTRFRVEFRRAEDGTYEIRLIPNS